MREFFDTLTAYANVILPGVGKTDLAAFWSSQKTYDALPAAAKLAEQSWLIDEGAKLPAATAALEPMAGKVVWGCSGWKAIPDAEMRGECAGAGGDRTQGCFVAHNATVSRPRTLCPAGCWRASCVTGRLKTGFWRGDADTRTPAGRRGKNAAG